LQLGKKAPLLAKRGFREFSIALLIKTKFLLATREKALLFFLGVCQ